MTRQKEGKGVLKASEDDIICKHCKEIIHVSKIIGFSLVCPSCNKPQNGRMNLTIADFQEK